MERMLKRIAIRKDGTISMSEFRNFAEKYQGEIDRLEEENKRLRAYADNLDSENDNQAIEIEELKEKVRFLEECLDRKEKLNEKYRKEIEELKSTYVYDAKQVRDIC